MDSTDNIPMETTLEESQQEQIPLSLIPTASISLSLSTLIPSHFIPPKPITNLPTKAKIPNRISSLSQLSLASTLAPSKLFSKTTVSANPLQSALTLTPLRPSNPPGAAAVRRVAVVWFRNDLRIHDNECLTTANNECLSVLPVYCFDPRDYGKSSSGFDKTGPYRATFLIESVSDLRKNLQARGSDLVVRVGMPENVLLEMAKAVRADVVYMHREVSRGEVKEEEKIGEIMKDEGVEVKYFWGSTLYHLEDLPFELEHMPRNYGKFKEKVKGLDVRQTIEALDRMKGLPRRGDVEPGEIPSLVDLGLNPNAAMGQNGRTAANVSLVGGETEALQRLKTFSTECKAKPTGNKNGTNDSIYGANFSCKISPWLAVGCLSPRTMFDELKMSASSMISAASNKKHGGSGASDTGTNWLMYELLWRDFFRLITRKYSTAKQPIHAPAPAPACT
ncbi:blue-light photoreceptor PHR2-like [Andrographis paniculata]|uniref:blue-light photoreceptor PHR2-like n=1 Tax=Andrographis paniculata TaxID=175694 RepID=UPI0021E786EB|nr:blue-light photoreceptor PHR2-like [Andrographis paniculata]